MRDSTFNYLKTKKKYYGTLVKEVARASTAGRPLPLPVHVHRHLQSLACEYRHGTHTDPAISTSSSHQPQAGSIGGS